MENNMQAVETALEIYENGMKKVSNLLFLE